MFLSKRKGGFYHLYYNKPNGKLTSITTKTKIKSEALRFLTIFQAQQEKIALNAGIIPIKLKKFAFLFMKAQSIDHADNSIANYKTTFNSLANFFKDVYLEEISPKKLQEYFIQRVRKKTIYPARKDRINLGYAFNWAVKNKYLLENPCRDIKRFKIPEKQPVFFSEKEYESLISVITEKDILDLVIFAVNTGLRQMELLKLQWGQVDLLNRFLILDNSSHITKSKRIRTITLNRKALAVIEDRLEIGGDFVFTCDGRPMLQDFICKRFRKYVIKAKINEGLTFHSLRHTFATWLVQRGASIYEVSKLLGHADIKTTEIYSHLSPEDLRGSTDLLND